MWHVEISKSNKMLGNTDALDGYEIERTEDFELDDVNDDDDELEKLEKYILDAAPAAEKWYHGRLDRSDAELRLHAQSLPCSYLVRESTSKLGIYSLSYMNKALMISHFRITAICGDYYIGGRKFQSLHHLIGYYSTYGSLMKNEKLEVPIPPPEPVHLAHRVVAIFPYNASPDSDELSFAVGDVFSVKNHLDSDWLWVVAQKDNKSGLVPKALTEEMDSSADPYEGQSWFCAVNRDEAQTILMNYGSIGNFLIRPSDNQGDYSISLRDHTGVSRYLIRRQGRHFYIGGRTFESIEDIIQHYNKEQLAEGVSLKRPLDRSKYEVFYKSLHGNNRSKASVRSTGHSVPFVAPRRLDSRGSDRFGITKSGFLIKRGGRNKWRRLYMILKGDEQQLLYFENEKRAKPKGLFDLTYASVYKVHESLFGRANCLQVVVRALDETQTYFICAETSDAAQDWFECIHKYCGKMRNQSKNQKNVKELRSLELTICHAQKIPVNKLPHPYCIISLNDIKTCKTKAKEAPEPVFDEEFKFDDLPSDISSFTVALYNRKAAPYKDKEMGRVTIFLNTLEPGKVLDQWFTLGSLQHKSEMGSIRLTAKFVHEIIMPIDEYSKLQELLLSKDYQLVQTLGDVSKDLNILAYTLLRIFRQNDSELDLIQTITLRELNDKEKKETLFRGNSLATKLMDQYMKLTAIPYLQKTIKGVITKIMDSKQCCELNPARVEKGSNVAENLQQLIKFLEEITSNIFNSVHNCPKSLRYLFNCLQQEASKLWPGDDSVRQRVVSAFLFLRLIVPGILYPKMHNLINESPSAMSSRTLTLVASCLQKLANLVEFGAKEPYLAVVNPFLQKYRTKMIDFLDEISNQPELPSTQESFNHDLARDLANIHEACVRHEHQLSELCAQQPSIRVLMVIVDHIKKTKEQYLTQSQSVCDEFAV